MTKNLAQSLNNILEIIETRCTDAGGEVCVNPANLDVFMEETGYLGERMGLTPFQAVIFAVIVNIHATGRCAVNKVAAALGMSYLQFLSHAEELEALRAKWLIRIKDNNEIKVPAPVISSLMKDTPYTKPKIDGLTSKSMFRRFASYLNAASERQMTAQQTLEEIEQVIEANPQICFSQACKKFIANISDEERYLFYIVSYLYVRRGRKSFDLGDVEDCIQDESWMSNLRDSFDADALGLQRLGIIEPAQENGMLSKGCFCIKEDVAKEMFADARQEKHGFNFVHLTDWNEKPAKELFYNPSEKEQIDRLGELLKDGSLDRVYKALTDKGLRTGFTCLFYGAPGTGKTETVYQLARRTGRKIMEADVAELRNCYVGETEKNMRALFEKYRTANAESDLTPILLFNEADAILGKRMDGVEKFVDRMENSVQNILLEEMEKFSGIMIATTNLFGNFDPAFERRFLFKVSFNKPGLEPRSLIWKSQFPLLTDEQAHAIAEDFPFSGGQIENVVRKWTVDSILSGREGGFDDLRRYCREESVPRQTTRRIGF